MLLKAGIRKTIGSVNARWNYTVWIELIGAEHLGQRCLDPHCDSVTWFCVTAEADGFRVFGEDGHLIETRPFSLTGVNNCDFTLDLENDTALLSISWDHLGIVVIESARRTNGTLPSFGYPQCRPTIGQL